MDSHQQQKRKKNPRDTASWISIVTFLFTMRIFQKGLRGGITQKDVYRIISRLQCEKLGNKFEYEWKAHENRKHRMIRILMKLFWKEYFTLGILYGSAETIIVICYPLILGKLVSYFTPGQKEVSFNDALVYALALVALYVMIILSVHVYLLLMSELVYKMKISVCAVIFRKCLKLSPRSVILAGNGYVVTLMTKDIVQFDYSIEFALSMVVSIIQAVIMSYIMYEKIGSSALIGVAFFLLCIPLFVYLGKKTSIYRLRTAAKTDQRVRVTQEILTSMRIIKMYVWENFFSKVVNLLRKKEIRDLRILFYVKAVAMSIGNLSSRLAFYICVMAYIALGNHITAEKAFVVTGCFGALRSVLTVFMPLGIAQLAELKASIQRITNFLLLEEVPENPNSEYIEEKQTKVLITNASVRADNGEIILQNIHLDLKQGLILLTGSVGSGKSTLLKLILGDIRKSEGMVEVSGKMSYASQEPWLFPGTVRQNIIFGEWFDENRYETVIKVCALRKDFEALPQGDKTYVTDRGLNLSRGQKARINLARAVYKPADIYLFDDCLSAVDTHVGRHIFEECMKEFLKGSIVVLVSSHHGQFLREVDNIVVLSENTVKFQGDYYSLKQWNNEEIKKNLNGFTIDSTIIEKKVEEKIANEVEEEDETTALLVKSTENVKNLYEETKEEGQVSKKVYYKYFTSGGGVTMMLIVLFFSIMAQVTASWSDYFVSFWVDMEQEMSGFRLNQTTNSTKFKELEQSHDNVMKLYSFVILGATVFTLLRAFSFFIFSSKASVNLHNTILDRILNAAMIFFDVNLSGNILNRFSRDLGIVDEQLPYVISEVIRNVLTLFGTLFVVSSVNLFFLIPSAILAIVLYFARRLYIPTGRSLKRLEGATRSPVIGHLNATLEGLTTIRASQAQKILQKEFDRHQDLYNSVSYMNLATTRAFGFYLDVLCSFYITVITLTFLFIKTDTLAGKVGLAITQSFSLTGLLQWGIRQWAELETQMTCTERVLEYTKVEPEDRSGDKPASWSNAGKIEYKEVNLRYSPTSERVLKDISFVIEAKQRIGIVGRTGAGKSSIVSVLFRMYEYRGVINVDDVDINGVAVDLLRSKLSIIPQDPVLFSGTIRSNLDPNGEYDDKQLWDALEEVEMKKLVGDLDSIISEGGSNFSIGQRQLLCLARAIIRQNNILILDEATANVDPRTDALIQRTIKRKFNDCTVITIAHRLNTIMDSDMVLVMDSGEVIEYDPPKILIEKRGVFYSMVKEAGLL